MDVEYTMVAVARGQTVLWYRMFGDYQGEWMLLARDTDRYYIYKGWYGSCSGCDAIQSEFDYSDRDDLTPDSPKVQDFIKDYPSFLEMERSAALRLARRDKSLLTVLPANQDWGDIESAAVGLQLSLIVKMQEGAITADEILQLDNQEARREAIEQYGVERFVAEIGATEMDREGDDVLFHAPFAAEAYAFLYVKDSSTERRYVIRTDPAHTTVRAARAASFGIDPERFVLAQET